MRRLLTLISAVALLVTLLGAGASAAPSDGNGNKSVENIEEFGIPIFCDGDDLQDLWLDVEGFVQEKGFVETSPNEFLAVFHVTETWTNAEGDSWVWRDRGPDRGYVDQNGDFIVTITGRSGVNNIGHVVINESTGEVEQRSGLPPFGGELFEFGSYDYACDLLTG